MDRNFKNNISRLVDSGIYKKISSVLSMLIIIAFLLYFIFDLKFIYMIHLISFTVSFYAVIDPVFIYISKISKDEDVNNNENIKLIIISILTICLIGNIYNIVYSGEKIVYISYILVMTSGIILIAINQYKKAVNIINDEEKKNKILAIIGSNLFIVLYIFIFLFNSKEVFLEKKVISLDEIENPSAISIYKHEERKSRNDIRNFLSQDRTKIENKEIMNKFNKEIQGKKLENLRGISYIDYSLKTIDKYPYYSMTFVYNKTTEMRRDLEKGYITYIKLYDDGKIIISEFDHDTKEYQRYKTFISKELAKQIISHF